MHGIEITYPCPHWQTQHAAIEDTATRAVLAVLADQGMGPGDAQTGYEISIVMADDALVRALNRTWRNIDTPTNVLSFPADDDDGQGPCLLGDIVLAYETIQREAIAAGRRILDHVSHLIVHGSLHLLGFDHEEEHEAVEMEARETAILARIGVADPYQGEPGGSG